MVSKTSDLKKLLDETFGPVALIKLLVTNLNTFFF